MTLPCKGFTCYQVPNDVEPREWKSKIMYLIPREKRQMEVMGIPVKYLFHGFLSTVIAAVVIYAMYYLSLTTSFPTVDRQYTMYPKSCNPCTCTCDGNHTEPDDTDKAHKHEKHENTFPTFFHSRGYHKIYPVNCSAIFAGDENSIKASQWLLDQSKDTKGKLPLPTAAETLKWANNCKEFKSKRGYPEQPFSKEEADYPIAYSMVVYTASAQVERLLRSIYQPQNVYCIHVDKKSPVAFHRAIKQLANCFENVFIASKLEVVRYRGFTALLADLRCMEDLLRHPMPWKYVFNLCGMDFPLKTNLELVRQLKAYNNHNCIEGYIEKKHEDRIKFSKYTHRKKGPAPHKIIPYKGDTYIAATREFVDFFINDKVARDYLKWLKDADVPDEYFTSALNRLPYAPGGHVKPSMECNVRFRKWSHARKFPERPKCIGKNIRNLCIFGAGYLKYLQTTPELFVNKLRYDFDPISIQCLEEELHHRTVHPEKYHKLRNFPVKNFSWQIDTGVS